MVYMIISTTDERDHTDEALGHLLTPRAGAVHESVQDLARCAHAWNQDPADPHEYAVALAVVT